MGWYTGLGPNTGAFRRLDGESGATIDELEVADWAPLPIDAIRPYGGAIDASGDFWALSKGNKIVRIDGETLATTAFEGPVLAQFYGLAMDANGEPWIGGCGGALYHVNLTTGQIETTDTTDGCLRGLQIDREGRGWIAAEVDGLVSPYTYSDMTGAGLRLVSTPEG